MKPDLTSPTPNPMHQNNATGMTHRTARQSFAVRRDIERQRSTIGSYEAAAKKSLIEAHDNATSDNQSYMSHPDYYKEIRQSLGIKTNDTKRNPYSTNRQADGAPAGRASPQSLNAKTSGLVMPKRSAGPTFREPQGRSFNPFS